MISTKFYEGINNGMVVFLESKARGIILKDPENTPLPKLDDTATVATHLVEGNYLPLLRALHTQKPEEKLVWLKKHAGLHAPLLYEQAITKFKENPSARSYAIAEGIIMAATFRARQDSLCSLDPDIAGGSVANEIDEIYTNQLSRLRKKSKTPIDKFEGVVSPTVTTGLIQAAKGSRNSLLPPPHWIAMSKEGGLSGANKNSKGKMLLPTEHHQETRAAYAQDMLTNTTTALNFSTTSSSTPQQE